jgi:hypothetical protein
MKRLGLLLVFVVSTIGSSSGCSWIFVTPLPDKHVPGDYANCTTNAAFPVIDTAFAVSNIGFAIYEAGQNNVPNKGAVVTSNALSATLWISSALYGYMKTSDCRDAEDAYYDRPRRLLRPSAPPARYYHQPPAPAAVPSVTAPSSAPASPTQQEDDDEPGERRPPPEPANSPRGPSKGQPVNPNFSSSGA